MSTPTKTCAGCKWFFHEAPAKRGVCLDSGIATQPQSVCAKWWARRAVRLATEPKLSWARVRNWKTLENPS